MFPSIYGGDEKFSLNEFQRFSFDRFKIVCVRAGRGLIEKRLENFGFHRFATIRVISIRACPRSTLRGGRLVLETSWVSAEVSVGSFTGRLSDVD